MKRLRLAILDERGGSSLTPSLMDRLHVALQASSDASIVTLEGGSAAFCTGMDPDALAAKEGSLRLSDAPGLLERFAKLLEAIERAPRPVLALVDGPVIGGGIGLAAAADLVLATPRATFGLPEVLLGLIPAMIFPALARRVGVPRARWLALGAATLRAEDALRLGLVDELSEDLEVVVERYTQRLLRMDPRSVAEVKLLVAEHYCARGTYHVGAAERFRRLLESPRTQARLARFAAGDAPWLEDTGQERTRGVKEPSAEEKGP